MYKAFLVTRYLGRGYGGTWISKIINLVAVGCVALCVALVLVVLSVMGGFLDTVRERSKGLHAEIVIDPGTMQGFPYYGEFAQRIEAKLPEVVRVTTPVIWTYGLFRVPRTKFTKPTRVLGVDLDKYVQVNDFKKGLHYERYFPGTTHLGKQAMPVAGVDELDRLVLPPDLVAANQKWRAAETEREKIAQFDAEPFVPVPFPNISAKPVGERAFSVDSGEPGYRGPELSGVIVGCDLVNRRRADGNFDRHYVRGADVALTLLPLSPSGNINEMPVSLPMRYVDDSRTGIFEIDSLAVYVDFNLLQQQVAMDAQQLADGGFTKPRANQLLVGLKEGADLLQAKALISAEWKAFYDTVGPELSKEDDELLSFVEVLTWEDLQRQFIQAVEKEKVLVTFLFALVFVVVIALIGCIFYMIVEKKTRDVGLLKAVGASGRGVAGLFIVYAGAVGLVGSILGIFVGCLFVWNINDIQDYLAQFNPQLRVWSPDVYSFDRIPEVVKKFDAAWIGALAIVSSMVGSVIPSIIAGLVWPVRALRYE
jgi:lipoprotein-releasing system permease protein